MKKTKLSIITPSYNQAEFIADTLQSIVSQPHAHFDIEYIIMDAVSSDTTKSIVQSFFPRFKKTGIACQFVCEKDNGQTDAINKGIARSTGDIITYLNSDDYYEPKVLAQVVQFFEENPQIQWAYGGWNYVNRTKDLYTTVQPKLYSYDKLLDYCVIGQPSCFFRRFAYTTVGPFDDSLHLGMDYDYWLRLSQHFPAGIIPTVISNMRYYGGTKSGSQAKAHVIEAYRLASRFTPTWSFKRVLQLYYLLRGYLVIALGIDITRRIERKTYGK